MKSIKNYTTEISAFKTINEVQSLLMEASATGIATEIENGQIKSMFFKIKVDGQELPFKLPAKPQSVYKVLFAGKHGEWRYKEERMQKANNIAWRIVKDWLEIQLSLIKMQMAKPQEVFLPYLLVSEKQTLFEQSESSGYVGLLGSSK